MQQNKTNVVQSPLKTLTRPGNEMGLFYDETVSVRSRDSIDQIHQQRKRSGSRGVMPQRTLWASTAILNYTCSRTCS